MPHGRLKMSSGTTDLTAGNLSWHCHQKKEWWGHSFSHSVRRRVSIPQAELGTISWTFRLMLIHPISDTIQNASKWNQTSSSFQPPVTLLSYQQRCGTFPLANIRLGIPPLPPFPHQIQLYTLIYKSVLYHFISTALPQSGKNILSPLLPFKRTSRCFCRSLRKKRHILLHAASVCAAMLKATCYTLCQVTHKLHDGT